MTLKWYLLAILIVASCSKEPTTESVRPVKAIQLKDLSSTENRLIFPGTLRAFNRADLSFRVDGVVVLRDITVGHNAKKDEVLIQLDPRDYEIALTKAKGSLESTAAQLGFAERDYERMKKIYETDPGAISASLLDRKKENKNQLTAELTIAEGNLQKAADDLSYTSLKAPFDGIVAAIYVENHEQVRQKETVVRLIDTAEREMEINIPEKYIVSMLEGGKSLKFKVYLDAYPNRVFNAIIKEIGTEASSTTQTFPITLTLQDIPIDLSLLAGMNGKAILEGSQGKEASQRFKVPSTAVFSDNLNKNYVWVIDPTSQTVHKKEVSISSAGRADVIYIVKGVSQGDWIVIAGTSFLSEGQKVKFSPEQTIK